MSAAHMSDTSKAALVRACGPFWLFALLPAFTSLVMPATAWGDIYKWTDEKGRTNYSDSPPPMPGKARNVEVVQKEIKPTPTEQALLERIKSLERQVQTRQYATQAPGSPLPTPYGGGYPSTPPPPPSDYYDSGYDGSYYPASYPGYYPNYYYPVMPVYPYAFYPRRGFKSRPVFVAPRSGFSHSGGGSIRGGAGHRGRR